MAVERMAPSSYLLILGERAAVYWVLSRARTAFVSNRRAQAMMLQPGDRLFLYTTRGAWHNPTRHRGRIIGLAEVSSRPEVLEVPAQIAGREFSVGLDLRIDAAAPFGEGVVLADWVGQLAVFPDKARWAYQLRTSLLRLPREDGDLLEFALKPLAAPLSQVLPGYLHAARLDTQDPNE